MNQKKQSFQTSDFLISDRDVDYFGHHYDGNNVHLGDNFNEILPPKTAPGLLVMALASKALLQQPEYKEILCARSFEIKFMKPVFRGQHLFVRGQFTDEPHSSRKGVIFRVNDCEVVCRETQEVVIRYQITQLLRA